MNKPILNLRDFKSDGYGYNFSQLPRTQKEARELGISYYYSGIPCRHGHTCARYAISGNCTICSQKRSAERRGSKFDGVGYKGIANLVRSQAAQKGSTTYIPIRPCKHGHKLRYTASNNCVTCDSEKHKKNAVAKRYYRIKSEYGLTKEQYCALVEAQGSSCAICGAHHEDNFKLHVDHCHETGEVRGLLCSKCNQGIGLLKHSTDLLEKAKRYLS